jgi:hypothetical protein
MLELLARTARAHDTKLIMYMGPVLPAVPSYYSPEDMSGMQGIMYGECQKYRLSCFDYRELVPRPLWGDDRTDHSAPGAALDYVHLPGEAHRYLAVRLFNDIRPELEGLGAKP